MKGACGPSAGNESGAGEFRGVPRRGPGRLLLRVTTSSTRLGRGLLPLSDLTAPRHHQPTNSCPGTSTDSLSDRRHHREGRPNSQSLSSPFYRVALGKTILLPLVHHDDEPSFVSSEAATATLGVLSSRTSTSRPSAGPLRSALWVRPGGPAGRCLLKKNSPSSAPLRRRSCPGPETGTPAPR